MFFEKASTRIIGIGKFGQNALEVIKKSWSEEACIYLENAEEAGEFSYINLNLDTTEEEINSIFEFANTAIILSDASADLELTEKVAKTAKAEGLFTVIGLANGTEKQASVLEGVSDSAIMLPTSDYDVVFKFVETLINPMYVPGVIGIDWEDVKSLLKESGVGCFALGNGKEVDSIILDCLDNIPNGFELNTAKSVLINITSFMYDMYFIDCIMERVCEHLNDAAHVCYSAQIPDDLRTSYMGIIVVRMNK